jgi:hypothetical protein
LSETAAPLPPGQGALLAKHAFLLAALVPAPLEIAADPARPPNPAKAAWFLLWIQELVSYHTLAIGLVMALALLLVALPWLPLETVEHAAWCQRPHWPVVLLALLASGGALALTAVGLFLRGAGWRLVSPF